MQRVAVGLAFGALLFGQAQTAQAPSESRMRPIVSGSRPAEVTRHFDFRRATDHYRVAGMRCHYWAGPHTTTTFCRR